MSDYTLPLDEKALDELEKAHEDWAGGEWLVGDAGKEYHATMSAIYAGKLFDPESLIVNVADDSAAALAAQAVNALPALIAQAREAIRLRAEVEKLGEELGSVQDIALKAQEERDAALAREKVLREVLNACMEEAHDHGSDYEIEKMARAALATTAPSEPAKKEGA